MPDRCSSASLYRRPRARRAVRLGSLALRLAWAAVLLLGVSVGPGVPIASAATVTWIGAVDTNWNNCANWYAGVCPGTNDVALFNSSSLGGAVISGSIPAVDMNLAYGFQYTVTVLASTGVNNLTIDSGWFVAPDFLNVAGNFEQSGSGTFVAGTRTVTFTGTNPQTIDTTQVGIFYAVTVAGNVVLSRPLDVGGTLTIASGTLDSYGYQIAVAGDWNHTGGTFNPRTGTVVLDGSGAQAITGSNAFYSLKKTTGLGPLTFQVGTTQAISGTLTLQGGGPSSLLSLRSSTPGSAWNLNVSQTPVAAYLDVQDSHAATFIQCPNCQDSGHNTNWLFTSGPTPTPTPTSTATPTITLTPSVTPTPSITLTPSVTPTPSITLTPSITPTPSVTSSPTTSPTSTPTVTDTPIPTSTATGTRVPTATATPVPTATPTLTPSLTPSITPSPSETLTPSDTLTPTATLPSATPAYLYQAVTLTPPPAGAVVSVAQRIDRPGGRLVCGLWEVIVPENSVPDGTRWHCETLDPAAEARVACPDGFSRLWRVVVITATTADGRPLSSFQPPLTVCAHYSDVDYRMAGNDPSQLKIYSAHAADAAWGDLSAAPDQAVPRVCAPTGTLSAFQLLVKSLPRRGLAAIDWTFILLVAIGVVALAALAVLILIVISRRQKAATAQPA
jgi:hypothetical protein